jgi:hypothetical protein
MKAICRRKLRLVGVNLVVVQTDIGLDGDAASGGSMPSENVEQRSFVGATEYSVANCM